ncbi:sterol desaturase family protein [Undibacterium sp. RuTC16W]|uniref:sterol desaturase family protein n=1 Tax=Undibacterium sp. RuTC16W TaxID=3413048 RepID=UPI003BF260A5
MNLAVYVLIGVAFVALFVREVMAPASKAQCDNRWLIMAGAINLTQMSAAIGAGYFFRTWLSGHSLINISAMHPSLSGLLTFFVASFIAYWWHRAMHKSDLLWRIFHQLHHSPSRIESLTAFYAHPFDSIAATFITCAVAYLIFGVSAVSVAWALLYVSLFNLYIHSDTASPRWLAYFIQRPEMHRVHHQLDHRAQNYGLPIWDLIFGTWHNPDEFIENCGFADGKGEFVYEMLMGKDVNA